MRSSHVLILISALAMAGCATTRGSMALTVPPASVVSSGSTPVYINQIADERVFEDKPAHPSTPSLKGGRAASESETIKSRAIARKRNSYGMALGDILLDGNQTVVDVMRSLLREGFQEAGYYVVDDRSKLGEEGLEVGVEIKEFWAWFTPGFFSVSMESQIESALHVKQGDDTRRIDVRAYGKNSGQSGREGNWIEAYRRAFEDYKAKIAEAF
jgi:hypothetical protein